MKKLLFILSLSLLLFSCSIDKMSPEPLVINGVDVNRISVEYYGKDTKFPKESVFDVARRVELIVTDKK